MVSTDPVWYYFPPWMLWQNRGMWSRRNSVCSESRPKAFDMSSGIPKLPITSWSVDNIYNRVLCCKSISINYNMHGWFLCWQHATGWVWWKSGLRAVAMWSSSSFTKSLCFQGEAMIVTSNHFLLWTYISQQNTQVVIQSYTTTLLHNVELTTIVIILWLPPSAKSYRVITAFYLSSSIGRNPELYHPC